MNKETRTALEKSIEKWRKIVAGEGEDRSDDNCALCQRFIKYDGCRGCPVAAKTGLDLCQGTPYAGFTKAFDRELLQYTGSSSRYGPRYDGVNIRPPGESIIYNCVIGPKTMAMAIAEYEFLVSLRLRR